MLNNGNRDDNYYHNSRDNNDGRNNGTNKYNTIATYHTNSDTDNFESCEISNTDNDDK